MKIILTEEYYIKSDPLNYELVAKKKTDTSKRKNIKNEFSENTVGFYRSINDAVERFLECVRKDKTTDFTGDVKAYCEEITRINNETAERVKETLKVISE